MKIQSPWIALGAAMILSTNAHAAYTQLLTASNLVGSSGAVSVNSFVIIGDTSYQITNRVTTPSVVNSVITRTTGVGTGTPVTSVLTTNAQISAAGGGVSFFGAFGIGQSSPGVLQVVDTVSNSVYRINQTTGAVTQYLSRAQASAALGVTNAQLFASNVILPSGEHLGYDAVGDSFYRTTGLGTASTALSAAGINGIAGNTIVNGGMAAVGDKFFWSSNTSDAIYSYDLVGALGNTVLTTAQIIAETGGTAYGAGDMFSAPDGNIYFVDNSSDSILSFNPSNPAGTLDTVLTSAQLSAGAANTSSVAQLGWFNGNLTFLVNAGGSAVRGVYVIPEPSTFGLALGALAMLGLRRKR
ncbi:MAG: PEP-CTERM sorting domain-containing protein [Verrucomicrobia bacterium]|nr:MAG: PEP-CTERM sorting domain-containing protein [Verrucomicrobiota bacterium]